MALHLEILPHVFLRLGIFFFITTVLLSTSLFYTCNIFIQSTIHIPNWLVDVVIPFTALPLQSRSGTTYSWHDSIAFFNLGYFSPPLSLWHIFSLTFWRTLSFNRLFLILSAQCFLMIKLRLYILSCYTIPMRLCPFQGIVLRLEANSIHLSLIDDVNFDHTIKMSP